MTKPRTLRAKSPADLLAMVPHVLGFHPEDSLVVMTVGDAEHPLHARVDLPDDQAGMAEVLAQIDQALARNGVRRVAVLTYTDDHCLAFELVSRLTHLFDAGGVAVVEAVRADGERWYSLTGCDGPCCPPGGTPYDVTVHPLTAQGVLEGQVTWRNRRELADSLVGTDLDAVEEVEAAADRATARFQATVAQPLGGPAPERARAHLVVEGRWVRKRVRRYLDDGVPLDSDDAGRLLVAMVSIEVRDVAWSLMDRSSAARHVSLWRDLVLRSPRDLAAAPAALLGFAAWLSGDGALAWCAVERCQESEPDYRLAALLSEALAAAISPASWRPVPEHLLTLFAG
ncbi:DUF4192 domain-containing protein [Nocardioides sp. WL0053]|uniref:DUF4192 domain-containing protein n=1 Tax=Nocardioides jiangsuensis TaxID=2866161 RepID=A0ABS7RF22_9ACTN|nr:DUF4192 domain-containing protein [Nocardioides jiangsuensis]MBY9073620.1 DUF4192 domain-containing protein [Nocardioides jiangsuensis]